MKIDLISGDKPHSCELCSKKFALACNLRAHMKTHEGKLFTIGPFRPVLCLFTN